MIKRNAYLLISLAAFLTFSLYLYNGIDNGNDMVVKKQQYVDDLRIKIGGLERLAESNGKTIDKLETELKNEKRKKVGETEKDTALEVEKSENGKEQDEFDDKDNEAVDDKEKGDELVVRGDRIAHIHQMQQRAKPTPSMANICSIRENVSSPHSQLQMLDLYDLWKFDNPDGGVWKQGWPIEYDAEKVKTEEMLEIIIIPHSHCDPGWIMTFEDYYARQTRNILNGMAKHLGEKDEMKFIYAEVSFFEMWWREQDEATRNKVKKYIENGKLEIVTGGWVMTDEANAHYHSMIVELFEGHEWILNHLGEVARPKSHWSIDPFGLSPSLPHLLTSANITNTVIQRVHYSVKRELALKKNLEFYWRQLFGQTGHSDMRTHIMPFYSYDVPHTCGPEPSVCCQFDFRRMPAGGKSCDWGIPPQKIDDSNVAERSQMIYDQYRKKSQLFKNNVIFAPLGDDFRYDIDFEWDSQYENYQKLFDYMNKKKEWNVRARFGTLKDYFNVMDEKMKKNGNELSTLSGDFFTYADRDDHYWSGYFTSRPFFKQLDRVLQHYLRSAEIAFTLASVEEDGMVDSKIFNKLVFARRSLALFQHHDGVTGTAKDHVMLDYGAKMIKALSACEDVLSESLIILLGLDTTNRMRMDEVRANENVLPEKKVYGFGQNVVLFNTLSRNRKEPVCIYVDSIDAAIEAEPPITSQQISPAFYYDEQKNVLVARDHVFELCFLSSLGPMSSVSYRIVKSTTVSKAKILTNDDNLNISTEFEKSSVPSEPTIDNGKTKAVFDKDNGMLKSVTSSVDSKTVDMNAHFVHYGTRQHKKKFANGNEDNPAGAYLFLPDGEAKQLDKQNALYVIIDGDIVKRMITAPNKELKVMQTYSLYHGQHYLDLDTEIDIRSKENFELSMKFESNVNSGDDFYTDLNGLQMIKRKRQSKLPMQANFYPMSAGVFIEDETTRFTIHSSQALGVSSLKSGQIEIMLDRRISSDDNRGLQQGVRDNKRTVSHLRILVEPMSSGGHNPTERVGFHSAVSHFATWSLHYPVVKMIGDATPKPVVSTNFEDQLNCDFHVVTMRTLSGPTPYDNSEKSTTAQKKAAMIMHRVVPDCRSKLNLKDETCLSSDYQIKPLKLITTLKESRNSTLTNMYEGPKLEVFELQPNDVSNILISW